MNRKNLAKSVGLLGWTDPDERGKKNKEWVDFLLKSFIKSPYYMSVDDWNLGINDWDETSCHYFEDINALNIFIAISKILEMDKELQELSREMGGISYVIFSKLPVKCCIQAYVNNDFGIKIKGEEIQNTVVIEIFVPRRAIDSCKDNIEIDIQSSFQLNNEIIERKKLLSIVEKISNPVKIVNLTSLTEFDRLISTCSGELANQFEQLGVKTSNEELNKYLKYIIRNLIYFFSIADKITPHNIKEIVYIPGRGFIHEGKEMTSGGITIWVTDKTKYVLEELLIAQTIWCRRVSIWDWSRKTQFHALRSAVAAIMARNWAHIFASQVLLRFRHANIGGIGSLSEYISQNRCKMPGELFDYLKESNIAIPEGLLDYIATRSEYIANVTGEIPLLWGEGYIEERGETVSGIIEEFRQTFILRKLCEATGGKFNNIRIVAENLDQRIGFPFGMAVGRHAVYGILENYIRNVSKYGSVQDQDKELLVHLSGSVNSKDRGFITVKLTSNSKIAENAGEYPEKATQINEYVSQPVIDETGALPPRGWGFREMKIHACLLAGEAISFLSKKGQQDFFQFDLDRAKKDGVYWFYFKVRRYEPFLLFEDRGKVEDFIRDPLKFPLADFIVLHSGFIDRYTKETWEKFSTRVCILGTKSSKPSDDWLKKKVIYIDNIDNKVDIKEDILYMKFWNLLKNYGATDFKGITIFENDGSEINITCSDGSKIAIYHADENSKRKAQSFASQNIIRFSHQKCMMIWINEVKQKKHETRIKYKWKTLLGSKVLLIDNRLFEQYENMGSETKQELELLGICVVPETVKIIEDLHFEVNDRKINLNQFQFISVHLGYLEENPNTPLLCEDKLKNFPPFIFMHTARGKIDREFITKHWWFKKIISAGSLISSLNEEYGLEIKIRLMSMFLSPQQGGLKV
jgi:hypothetical protein